MFKITIYIYEIVFITGKTQRPFILAFLPEKMTKSLGFTKKKKKEKKKNIQEKFKEL